MLFEEQLNGDIKNSSFGGSVTSILIPTDKTNYYIDSEKTPLYDNEQPSYTLAGNSSREVQYTPIQVGSVSSETANPIIPALSFRDNLSLQELEKVLVKKRLENAKISNISTSITPQGFLKKGSQFEYIKTTERKGKSRKNNLFRDNKSTYRFIINNADLDFNLSISKEDVFFVITPQLLKDISFDANFDIFFGIHGFDVDLILNDLLAKDVNNTERIIIFKYSRHTIDELLDDTSKWSNYGKFKNNTKNDWSTWSKEVKEIVKKESSLPSKKNMMAATRTIDILTRQ